MHHLARFHDPALDTDQGIKVLDQQAQGWVPGVQAEAGGNRSGDGAGRGRRPRQLPTLPARRIFSAPSTPSTTRPARLAEGEAMPMLPPCAKASPVLMAAVCAVGGDQGAAELPRQD